jgi:site-specific recombinase XerD
VRDVIIDSGIIYIEKTISKNRKSQPVTIPDLLLKKLENHIKKARAEDYIFSNNFTPGNKPITPKRISDEWVKLRNKLNLSSALQWYSLKDTGITNLLKAGVPLIAVRDQARHHSSNQTDAYTPKENESIKRINI